MRILALAAIVSAPVILPPNVAWAGNDAWSTSPASRNFSGNNWTTGRLAARR